MGWGYGGRERLHGALQCDVMFELHRIASHHNTEITIVAALKGIEIVLDKVPCPGQIECMRIRFVSCCTSMSWLALPLGSQDHSHHMSHGCDAMRWGGTMVWTWEGIASRRDAMA